MKNNKLFILNIISYITLYHIVFEGLIYLFNYSNSPTPLGYYLFYYEDESLSDKPQLLLLTIGLIFNFIISIIFWRYLYKWENKKDTVALILNLVYLYFVTGVILFVLFLLLMVFTEGVIFVIYFILYLPMLIMVILMVPLFRFNQWILSKFSK